jgi:hypothetical protein
LKAGPLLRTRADAERQIYVGDDFNQLASEMEWIRGEQPGSMLAMRGKVSPPEAWVHIAKQVEPVLKHDRAARLLAILGEHNAKIQAKYAAKTASHARRDAPYRQPPPFLLAPHLFHIIHSIQARSDVRNIMPVLDQPPAQIRDHLSALSTKAKRLAKMLRKGPQPRVALAKIRRVDDAIGMFLPSPVIHSDRKSAVILTLDQLLDKAAASLSSIAMQVTRAEEHRRPAKSATNAQKEEKRSRASIVLVHAFRKHLGQPYHDHIAKIAGLLSDIPTDSDYVKKVAKRSGKRPVAGGDKVRRNRR